MMSVHRSVLIYLLLLKCSILVATAIKDRTGEVPCPDPFRSVKHWKDSSLQVGCYEFTGEATFEVAKIICENSGGSLVGDDSVHQQQSLAIFYKDSGIGKVWIGAKRDTIVDPWKWVYSEQNLTFHLWRTAQPSNHSGNKNCILWDGDNAWEAASCDSTSNGALCQYYGEQGKMWGEWSDWSEMTDCSRRCGGGKQQFRRSRSCSSAVGCAGQSEYTQRDCYTLDCDCEIRPNTTTKRVRRFCEIFPEKITSKEMEDFCKFSETEKREALLCTEIDSEAAEFLLNIAYKNIVQNCEYDPNGVFEGDCGQKIQDKLSYRCKNADCETKQLQLEVQGKIEKVMNNTDELYRNKIEQTIAWKNLTKWQLELVKFENRLPKPEFEKKQKEIMEDFMAKLKKNSNMGVDEKNKVKHKAWELLRTDVVKRTAISAINTKLENLKEREDNMKIASKVIKREYKTLKEKFKGISSTAVLEKGSKAIGHVLGSVTKFKKGDTKSVIGGVLDIASGISQFLPPPASIVTETISSIFNLFSGKTAPTTESIIKDEFKKQKEWMEDKFDEIDKHFEALSVDIRERFERINNKIDKSFNDLQKEIDSQFAKLTDNQKELLLLKGLTDQRRKALGMWFELEQKLDFIIENEGKNHDVHALSVILNHMEIFSNEAEKFEFRDMVKTECKNKTSTVFREHCQALAYSTLIIDRTDEILLTKTMALLAKSVSFSTLTYDARLKSCKQRAKKFLEEIFTSKEKNDYSYISCGLSKNSNATLTDEQKANLFAYAEHLDPSGTLVENLEQRKKCVDGRDDLPWKIYSSSSTDRNAAVDNQMRECCNKGKMMQIKTCFKPEHGGVDCLNITQCYGNITLGYCLDVNTNQLIPGTELRNGDTLKSPSGKFGLVMADGDLVFYSTRNNKRIQHWNTHTKNTCPGATFHLQTDGNMVIYNDANPVCWSSHTNGKGAANLTITDDPNLILTENTQGDPIWSMTKQVYCSVKEDLSGIILENNWRTQHEMDAEKMSKEDKKNIIISKTAEMTGHTTSDLKNRPNDPDKGSLTAIANIASFLIKYGIRDSSEVKTMTYEPDLRNTLINEISQRFSLQKSTLYSKTDFGLLRTFCSQYGVHHNVTGSFILEGGDFGTWGYEERCSFPYFVEKMELKIEEKPDDYDKKGYGYNHIGDNTGLNGIRLTCSDGTKLTSTVAQWGEWNEDLEASTCPKGSYIDKARMRWQRRQVLEKQEDDTSANGIWFRCDGSNDDKIPGDGWWGILSPMQNCETGSAIIGLRTKVQLNGDDNTALNNVQFYCASLLK